MAVDTGLTIDDVVEQINSGPRYSDARFEVVTTTTRSYDSHPVYAGQNIRSRTTHIVQRKKGYETETVAILYVNDDGRVRSVAIPHNVAFTDVPKALRALA